MTNKTEYHGQKHFCRYCLVGFKNIRKLIKICPVINHTKTVNTCNTLDAHVRFQNFRRLLKAPFIIMYADFEGILKPVTDNKNDGPNTKKYQDHIVCSHGHKLT